MPVSLSGVFSTACVLFACCASAASPAPARGPAGPSSSRPRPGTRAPACAGAPVVVEVVAGNRTLAAFWGAEAAFGSPAPRNGTGMIALHAAVPATDACEPLEPASPAGGGGPPGTLARRGNCSFTDKAENALAANSSLLLVISNDTECLVMGGPDAPGELSNYTGLWAAGLDFDAGERLEALLENAGGSLSVVIWGVAVHMDYLSSALLWVLAVGTVVGGSIWSAQDLLAAEKLREAALGRQTGPPSPAAEDPSLGSQALTEVHAVAFLASSSIMLVVLFFLAGWIVVLVLIAAFALIGWTALTALLAPVASAVCGPSLSARRVSLPCGLGGSTASELAAAAVAGAAAATWVVFRHAGWAWVLQDLLGVSVCILFFRAVHLPSLKVAMILLPLMFAYDVFFVFLEPLIFGGPSVMVKVAMGGDSHEVIPMVLRVPYLTLDVQGTAILGLGDIVLPGLLAAFSRGVDVLRGTPLARGYFLPVATGYGVGLVLTYLALIFEIGGSSGQPALLYLVPCTLGTITVVALQRGDLRALMCGAHGNLLRPNENGHHDLHERPPAVAAGDEEAQEGAALLGPGS